MTAPHPDPLPASQGEGNWKFLFGFGLVFVLGGALAAWANSKAEPDPIEATPTASDAQALLALRPGSAVLLEGKVASSMPVVEEGLAVRQRQRVTAEEVTGNSSEHRLQWRVEASDPGPVEVELPGAVVKVGISAALWRDPPRKTVEDGQRVSGATRVIGFAPGDAIAVRGVFSRGREGAEALRVEAEEIYGGTAEAFRQDVRTQGGALMVVGLVFAVTGVVMSGVGGVLLRRRR